MAGGEFAPVTPWRPDPARYGAIFCALLQKPEGEIFVAECGGQTAGFIAVAIGQPIIWSADLVAEEQLLYVAPEHRSQGAAGRLLEAFEEWARAEVALKSGGRSDSLRASRR